MPGFAPPGSQRPETPSQRQRGARTQERPATTAAGASSPRGSPRIRVPGAAPPPRGLTSSRDAPPPQPSRGRPQTPGPAASGLPPPPRSLRGASGPSPAVPRRPGPAAAGGQRALTSWLQPQRRKERAPPGPAPPILCEGERPPAAPLAAVSPRSGPPVSRRPKLTRIVCQHPR